MGFGDEVMATGFARGAKKRGHRIAFGDGVKIKWTHHSEGIFNGNPNIAPPGAEVDKDIEWHPFCRGNRLYNSYDEPNKRWIWNYDFRAPRGEVYFTPDELKFAARQGEGYIVIEPNVCHKASAPNKQWSPGRYQELAKRLQHDGHDVRQPHYPGMAHQLGGVGQLKSPNFRAALALIARARLIVTCEGGMHHGAAAVGTRAVVIFGSFIPPQVTGYDGHENIAVGEACGTIGWCEHCREALASISVEQVHEAARRLLDVADPGGIISAPARAAGV